MAEKWPANGSSGHFSPVSGPYMFVVRPQSIFRPFFFAIWGRRPKTDFTIGAFSAEIGSFLTCARFALKAEGMNTQLVTQDSGRNGAHGKYWV